MLNKIPNICASTGLHILNKTTQHSMYFTSLLKAVNYIEQYGFHPYIASLNPKSHWHIHQNKITCYRAFVKSKIKIEIKL